MRPTISVIMPAYCAEATIADALRSIQAQTVTPDEVIVVDDGSPDGTSDIVAREFPSVRLLRQPNAGSAAARNTAALAAKGEWLAFLDADDAWLPGKLERQLRETTDPNVAVIAGRVVGRHDACFVPAPDFDALWERNTIATSSVMVRRDVFAAEGGMALHLPPCEDYNLWLRLSTGGRRIVVCDEPVVVYAPNERSQTRHLERFAEAERACLEDVAARYGVPQPRLRRRIAESYRRHARGALHTRDMKAARHFLLSSLKYDVSVAQVFDLAAASAPRVVLDLLRYIRGGMLRAAPTSGGGTKP